VAAADSALVCFLMRRRDGTCTTRICARASGVGAARTAAQRWFAGVRESPTANNSAILPLAARASRGSAGRRGAASARFFACPQARPTCAGRRHCDAKHDGGRLAAEGLMAAMPVKSSPVREGSGRRGCRRCASMAARGNGQSEPESAQVLVHWRNELEPSLLVAAPQTTEWSSISTRPGRARTVTLTPLRVNSPRFGCEILRRSGRGREHPSGSGPATSSRARRSRRAPRRHRVIDTKPEQRAV